MPVIKTTDRPPKEQGIIGLPDFRHPQGVTIVDAASQQKILGYFIEEAKEHLETLEQGILELSTVASDEERINELFRAAHSIKGGSAMLGYGSIQKAAHRLEDAFKILKENEIKADQQLESLFFSCYDILHALLDKLQSPFGLQEEEGNQIIGTAEPKFLSLQAYLDALLKGETPPAPGSLPVATPVPVATTGDDASIILENQLREHLREMLALLQGGANPESRKQLQKLCVTMAKLAKEVEGWQTLLKTAHRAIGNPKYSYRLLAPIVLQELKESSDLLVLQRGAEICPSDALQNLAVAKRPQILLPVDPKSAAKVLTKAFNQEQLSQLVQLLQRA